MNDNCNVSEMLFYILGLYADDTTMIIQDKDISILKNTENPKCRTW